jgi:heme/copper-type cytochrome/quinol oxidase subunit 2
MSDPTLFPVTFTAYVVAGAACLVVTGVVVVRLLLTDVRRGLPLRELTRQELIWTLVPALVLVGLTVIGEIPRGWGRAVSGDAARGAWSLSK